jgi:hypothetical protein
LHIGKLLLFSNILYLKGKAKRSLFKGVALHGYPGGKNGSRPPQGKAG